MIKQHLRKLTLASVLTVLPMLFGVIVWNRMPIVVPTHWGLSGADGYSHKAFLVFGIPLIMLAVFWLSIALTALDPKNKKQSEKAVAMVIWLIPMTSCFISGMMYALAFGMKIDLSMILALMFSALFIFIGNYLPKCKQNFTIGIRLRYTLESEDNWNATHRMTGKLWMFGGIVMFICAFLPQVVTFFVMFIVLIVMVPIPFIYSLSYRRKQLKSDHNDIKPLKNDPQTKRFSWIAIVAAAVILAGVAVLMFTGEVHASIEGENLVITATYWQKSVVPLQDLHHVQFTEDHDVGVRVNGFQSAKLQLGAFQNDLYGLYTMYAYNNTDFHILINDMDRVLVLSLKDEETTKAFYEELKNLVG